MKRYILVLIGSFLITSADLYIPQEFKQMSNEQLIEILMKYAKSSEDKKRVPDGVRAWEEIIYSDRFSSDEKFSILKDYYYNECIYKPYRMRIGNSETDILKKNIDNIVERFKKELKSKYAEDGCYRNKIIIALGYLGYGGREIGDEIIKIFDNPYGEFRVGAVEAFRIGAYFWCQVH